MEGYSIFQKRADAAGVDTVPKETEFAFDTFNYRGQGKASIYRSGMGWEGQFGYSANTSLVEDSELVPLLCVCVCVCLASC